MDELEKTFIEEYVGADEQLEKGRYKNAIILFSKALFAVCDYLIYSKFNKLPKNHSERFRLLENYFSSVYPIVDMIFRDYTDSYSKPVMRASCERIKNGIKKISRIEELPEEIKRLLE